VDEGKSLRQKLAFRTEFAKNTNPAKNLYDLYLRSTKDYVRKNNLFMQNEPKFRKSQMNLTDLFTREYEQKDTWSNRKNEPKRTQNEPKTNPNSKRPK
jgi:hypothetical protein